MIRIITVILALLIVLAGFSQLVVPTWWDGFTESLINSMWLRLWGVVGILIGAVLIAASMKRTIGLRLFLWVFGWLAALGGLAILINPAPAAVYTRAIYLDRAPETRVVVMWLSGLLRIGLGAAIYYAVVKPDTQVQS